ncbi:MAG TPA: ABC transporter substrate-binding protein [Polyangiaceae bacterium]|nr:ABC transporter substrate-binding protein [Polyangiaceae bacterium]
MKLARRAFLAALCSSASARALGRSPFAGTLRLRLPLFFGGLDPHALDDPLSALFAPAIADSLFAFDTNGKPYPALASALPERTAKGTRLSLRPELVTARGKALSASDVVFSFKRAQASGGAAVLRSFHTPSVDDKDPLSVILPDADPEAVARALANPLTALVPRGFSPLRPDGTGAFSAQFQQSSLTLTRNERAARGAAFLDRIEVSAASDLADALRAFEAASVDVGWLGNGLYRARAGARPLEGPVYGWIVLRTGLDAKAWGAPGIAQQLCSALPADALSHFGVRALSHGEPGVRWGGGPSALLVCDDAPYLLELGRALEPLLGAPGNEVHAAPTARSAWLDARRSRRFGLMLDFVRAADTDPTQAALTLLAAVDPALAKRPPRNLSTLNDLTRTLTLGVLGEVRVSGSRMPEFEALETWQLGAVWSNSAKE